MTDAKLLTFIWKRQTLSSNREENMVTWSHLPFAVCGKRDAQSPFYLCGFVSDDDKFFLFFFFFLARRHSLPIR